MGISVPRSRDRVFEFLLPTSCLFTLSVRLCRTALPELRQARHALEFPPAFWVSSSPGYED